MNIIIDLDGTLLDSKLRLYTLFQHLVPDSQFSYAQYWSLKESKKSHEYLLKHHHGYSVKEIELFCNDWMTLIEAPQYLALDSNFEGIHDALLRLREQSNLHLCTERQFRQPVIDQLARLSLLKYFDEILVTEKSCAKEALILTNISSLSTEDWLIGDTGKDIQAAKLLNVNSCAVLTGFLNRESLNGYIPDLIIDSLRDFTIPSGPKF